MVGETLWLPSTANSPLMPEMLTEVAFVVAHVSVVDPPEAIEVEEAVKVSITGSGELTVTVAVAVALPVVLPAVSV